MTISCEWKAAYYPTEIPKNRRELTSLCLLFDQVIFHGITGGNACGGAYGYIHDVWEEQWGSMLIDDGVVILDEKDQDGISGGEYYDTDFNKYVDIQITLAALEKSTEPNIVPVTTNPEINIPVSSLNSIIKDAKKQSMILANESIRIVLPNFVEMNDEEILNARDKLSEHLIPFRAGMLQLSPFLRTAIQENNKPDEIIPEARYLVETNVLPILMQMEHRIKIEKQQFWRKLILKGASILPNIVINWTTKNVLSAAMESFSDAANLAGDVVCNQSLMKTMLAEGGIGYLLKLSEYNK